MDQKSPRQIVIVFMLFVFVPVMLLITVNHFYPLAPSQYQVNRRLPDPDAPTITLPQNQTSIEPVARTTLTPKITVTPSLNVSSIWSSVKNFTETILP